MSEREKRKHAKKRREVNEQRRKSYTEKRKHERQQHQREQEPEDEVMPEEQEEGMLQGEQEEGMMQREQEEEKSEQATTSQDPSAQNQNTVTPRSAAARKREVAKLKAQYQKVFEERNALKRRLEREKKKAQRSKNKCPRMRSPSLKNTNSTSQQLASPQRFAQGVLEGKNVEKTLQAHYTVIKSLKTPKLRKTMTKVISETCEKRKEPSLYFERLRTSTLEQSTRKTTK